MLNPRALSLAPVFLCLVACQTTPPIDVYPDFTTDAGFARVNPRDVAVLPIEDATAGMAASHLLELMREDMDQRLVGRRYSPLNTGFVDAALTGASGGGASGGSILSATYLSGVAQRFDDESAVLAVRLDRWDESGLLSRSRVAFQAQAVLVSGAVGTVLWSGQISGSLKAGGEGPAPIDPDERSKNAARMFVEQLLLNLPMRHL